MSGGLIIGKGVLIININLSVVINKLHRQGVHSLHFVRTPVISNYAIGKKVAIILTVQPVPFPAWRYYEPEEGNACR